MGIIKKSKMDELKVKETVAINDNNKDKIDKKPLRPCCACPDTRNLRDECIRNKSEEECLEFINKHNECLRSQGFKV